MNEGKTNQEFINEIAGIMIEITRHFDAGDHSLLSDIIEQGGTNVEKFAHEFLDGPVSALDAMETHNMAAVGVAWLRFLCLRGLAERAGVTTEEAIARLGAKMPEADIVFAMLAFCAGVAWGAWRTELALGSGPGMIQWKNLTLPRSEN